MLSARNILKIQITKVESSPIISLVTAKLENNKTIKSLITTESVDDLNLKINDNAIAVFKANSVIVSKNECATRLSSANELNGKIVSIKNGSVYSIIEINCNGILITASITNDSANKMDLNISDNVNVLIKASDIFIGIKE
ncbi:TOBE domain-containing protein [Campylobacter sp. RM12640]|uniref:TOBE domain-containing protein n=1 Tax=unclassified Campylobacter TaxID=2593542 RepID=UPI00301428DC|nr:TOBE domain-containing protein [Campylobacter sp. RM12640]MBZ7989229.1 TOBE domain-containing protein [Campylobacter sp. RM12635]